MSTVADPKLDRQQKRPLPREVWAIRQKFTGDLLEAGGEDAIIQGFIAFSSSEDASTYRDHHAPFVDEWEPVRLK